MNGNITIENVSSGDKSYTMPTKMVGGWAQSEDEARARATDALEDLAGDS